jgi:hypothetical protein
MDELKETMDMTTASGRAMPAVSHADLFTTRKLFDNAPAAVSAKAWQATANLAAKATPASA